MVRSWGSVSVTSTWLSSKDLCSRSQVIPSVSLSFFSPPGEACHFADEQLQQTSWDLRMVKLSPVSEDMLFLTLACSGCLCLGWLSQEFEGNALISSSSQKRLGCGVQVSGSHMLWKVLGGFHTP